MFLISWNVAGWAATTSAIRACYDGTLRTFLAYTHADIVCIQECKGTRSKRDEAPELMGASDGVPARTGKKTNNNNNDDSAARRAGTRQPSASGIAGWESFWCHASQKHRGFNGVLTLARDGLTWACDARPFGDDTLDDEGRALVTYHSAFVLVNVYVPNARGGQRLAFKLRFLDALSRLLTRLRAQTGKPIILVGDMNVTYRVDDAAWTLRRLALAPLAQLCADVVSPSSSSSSLLSSSPAAAAVLTPAALQRIAESVVGRVCDVLQDALQQQQQQETTAAAPSSATRVVAVDDAPPLLSSHDDHSNDTNDSDRDSRTATYTALLRRALRRRRSSSNNNNNNNNNNDTTMTTTAVLDELAALLRACDAAGLCSVSVDDLPKPLAPAHARELYAAVALCGLPAHGDASVHVFTQHLLQLPSSSSSSRTCVHDSRDGCNGCSSGSGDVAAAQSPRMYDTLLVTDDMVRAAAAAHDDNNNNNDNKTSAHAAVVPWTCAQRRAHTAACCPCPYTCWDQSRNRRQTNEGTRLDYILIDRELLRHVVCAGATENNVGLATSPDSVVTPHTHDDDDDNNDNSHAADIDDDFYSEYDGVAHARAVARAMAAGAYPTAPYTGAGLPPLAGVATTYAFRGLPSTGLFVTPPQFSDHIGVCLRCRSTTLTLQRRRGRVHEYSSGCMYKPPATLHMFFARKRPASEDNNDDDGDADGDGNKRHAADV